MIQAGARELRGQGNTSEPPLEIASKNLAHNKHFTNVSGSPEEVTKLNASNILRLL